MKNSLNKGKNVRLFPVPCTKNGYQFLKKTDTEKLLHLKKKSFSIRLRQLEQGTEEKDRIIMNTFEQYINHFNLFKYFRRMFSLEI